MAELVAGAFLSAAFEVLLQKIATYAVLKFFSKEEGEKFSERLSKLKTTMEDLCAVSFKVENKRTKNSELELWLDDLLDAIDDAEDLFGDMKYDALRPKEAESRKSIRKALLSIRSYERNTSLKKILKRLESLAERIPNLDVTPSEPFPGKSSLLDEDEIIYGREHDMDALMELIKSDDAGSQKICVIPILGMAGVGKTTLAQKLFNDEGVIEMFELSAWVNNSDQFDAVFVTETILQHVDPGSERKDVNLNLLQVNLKKKLMGKRFLIVLDNVNVSDDIIGWWTEVMKPLKNGAKGSKIIVTTRNVEVADSLRTVDTHHLRVLSDDHCWKVFEKYASDLNRDVFRDYEKKRIGKEITMKCNGFPLAAKVLGSLLRSTLDVKIWEEVSKTNIWTRTDKKIKSLLAALEESYYDLPLQLKRCFTYCSIFPKGYQFRKEEVVLIWMAAHLVDQDNPDMRMENIGGEYFDDLVSRSLFQLKTKTSTSTSYFVMHEFINDLARTVVAGKYFCLLESNASKCDKKTRHLGCVMQLYDIEASHLRTFLSLGKIYGDCISKDRVHKFLSKLKRLKVLSFRYYHMTELSESIGKLKHLRYLDLSHTPIVMLPESVAQLYNLQTLKLENCCKLKALPDDMHHLINLRHLIISGCGLVIKMPSQMRRLTNLQTLTNFVVGKDTGAAEVEVLAALPNLQGELSIQMLENVVNISEVKVLDKKKLEKLSLEWSVNCVVDDPKEGEGVLEMLSPYTTLKHLKILGYPGTDFPNWIGNDSFCNIVDVRLEDCGRCSKLPPFGHLPSLKNLHISGCDSVEEVGAEFYGNGYTKVPFSSLETLSFNSMLSWRVWETEPEDATPYVKLKTLEISNCPKLTGKLPYFLPSLTKLVIASLKDFYFVFLDMDLYSNLKTLSIRDCNCLFGLSQTFKGRASLSSIDIYDCPNFINFPSGGLIAPKLSHLAVTSCNWLKALPEKMSSLSSLKTLEMSGCPLQSLPEGGLPISLSKLEISYHQLLAMNWDWQTLPHLTCLSICGNEVLWVEPTAEAALTGANSRKKLTRQTCLRICGYQVLGINAIESFPRGDLLLPETITSLDIKNFSELKSLDRDGIRQLTSLQTLEISNCPKLQTLSEDAFPVSLTSLDTWNCPLLKQNYLPNENGIYKIGGVSQVSID